MKARLNSHWLIVKSYYCPQQFFLLTSFRNVIQTKNSRVVIIPNNINYMALLHYYIVWCSTITTFQYNSLDAEFEFTFVVLNIEAIKKFFLNQVLCFFLGSVWKLSTNKWESKVGAKCYYWERLRKVYMGYFYTTDYNCMWTYT